MDDIGIGDRQDDPRLVRAQPFVEHVLEVDHVGLAVGAELGVHAVIGGQDDGAAHGVELGHIAIHHRVKVVGNRRARRMFVLDVVSRREIHDLGSITLHQLYAGGEYELR